MKVSFSARSTSRRRSDGGSARVGLGVRNADEIIERVPATLHPHYGIHLGWQLLLMMSVIVILSGVAFISQLALLYWCASLSVGCLIMSLLVPSRMITPVTVTKTLADNGVVGQPMAIRFEVTNHRRVFGVYSIRLIELIEPGRAASIPRVYIPYLAAGRTVSFEVLVTPTRRGPMTFQGTRIASRYPFGVLTRFNTLLDGRAVPVYPALGRLDRRFVPGQRGLELFSTDTQSRSRGESDEFYALREYRHGDNPRRIHWRRSARMGQLLVREMSQYAPHRLTVILNTHMPSDDADTLDRFEQAVSFAATVLCDSLEKGYRTALVCAAEQPDIIPPLSGREAQHRVLRTLSLASGQTELALNEMVRRWRWTNRWRGRCLIVSLAEPAGGVIDRLADTIGPVQVVLVGSRHFRQVFVAPEDLERLEGAA